MSKLHHAKLWYLLLDQEEHGAGGESERVDGIVVVAVGI